MKRFLTFLAAIMMVLTAMAQSSGIVLSYNKGKELKFYGANQLAKAIDDAEANDTIYFGPGRFDLVYFITKPLTFIGSGAHSEGTFLTPYSSYDRTNFDVVLEIDSKYAMAKKTISFEGMDIAGINKHEVSIQHRSNLDVLKFVNVRLRNFRDIGSYVIDNLIFDRCYVNLLDLSSFHAKHVTVNNTNFSKSEGFDRGTVNGGCGGGYGPATFDHCYFNYIDNSFVGSVKHSIIRTTNADSRTNFDNCLWYKDNGSSIKTNCTNLDDSNILSFEDGTYSKICEDKTVYGTRGGDKPYTPYPQYPTPDISIDADTGKSKSYVEYDALNKKLTIAVKCLGD